MVKRHLGSPHVATDKFMFLSVLLIAISAVLELKSNYIRASVSFFGKSRYLGYVGWVQYQARLLVMGAVALVTTLFEAKGFSNIKEFVLFSSGASLILMLFYAFSPGFSRVADALFRPMSSVNYREESGQQYWRKISFFGASHVGYPFIIYFLLGVSVYVPFVLAAEIPEFRMTFAISGQLLNFLATVLLISVIEPRYLSKVDSKDELEMAAGMIVGRVFAAAAIFGLGWFL
jgi:hypothetical protein